VFPPARGNPAARGEGLDAGTGATPAAVHAAPARTGPGWRGSPGQGYQRQQLPGNSAGAPGNQRSGARCRAATNPSRAATSGGSFCAFPQLKPGGKLAKKNMAFFFF